MGNTGTVHALDTPGFHATASPWDRQDLQNKRGTTLCYLTGLRDPAHAAQGPMGGRIMETAVLSEIFKTLVHRGVEPRIYFWRTSTGSEVDIVVEADGKLVPIEVKLSSTPRPEMSLSIQAFQADLPGRSTPGYVVQLDRKDWLPSLRFLLAACLLNPLLQLPI